MSVARSVAEVLDGHVTLEIEGIDRMYLNGYVPKLQHEMGVVGFFRGHLGYTFASSALMDPITKRFIAAIEAFVRERRIDLIVFKKGQRKDNVAASYRARFVPQEGAMVVGHEYLKRQLAQEGVAFEALDNGLLSCAEPERAQAICDGLSAEHIDALFRKWLAILPNPFSEADRRAGYQYDLSILQVEFSLTQVLDRPLTGRIFFEEVIRENLDLGRPDQVQLIFGRRVTKRTPGRFQTRVITNGVTPSLPVSYKWTRIKQYHKEGRALRTETTINDTRDFAIGKRLHNLSALREVGFSVRHRRRQLPFPTASEGPIQHHGHAASEPQPRPPPQGGVGASGCLCRVGPGAKGGSSPLVGPQPGPGLSDHVRRDPQQAEPLG